MRVFRELGGALNLIKGLARREPRPSQKTHY